MVAEEGSLTTDPVDAGVLRPWSSGASASLRTLGAFVMDITCAPRLALVVHFELAAAANLHLGLSALPAPVVRFHGVLASR